MPNRTPRSRFDEVIASFGTCSRCGLFLAGYRNAFGLDHLRTAVDQSVNDWLQLTWTPATNELTHKAFGRRVDVGSFYYESCCPECYRVFVLQAADPEAPTPLFRIETRPHTTR